MSRAFFAFSTALLWHSLFDSIEFNSIELDCIWFDLIHQTVSLISASVKCLVRSVECRKSSRGSINFTILPMPLYLLQLNQSMDLRSRIWWALIFGHVYFYFTQPKKKKKSRQIYTHRIDILCCSWLLIFPSEWCGQKTSIRFWSTTC